MHHTLFTRTAPLLAAVAALAAACSELPSNPSSRAPLAPRATVTPTTPYSLIAGGYNHACGLTAAGQTYCWGRNSFGQLGDSSATNSSVPVAVWQQGESYAQITAGDAHSCALTNAGQAWCWGHNADGRLGDSTVATIPLIPVAVHQQSLSFTSISAGLSHTCALTSAGLAYCWGNNSSGQLGTNSKQGKLVPTAVQMPSGVTFIQIAAAGSHTCALSPGGQAYCWGYGGDGQLGYGATTGDSVPHAVSQGVYSYASISTKASNSCGLTSAGAAFCWGRNDSGQLGNGTVSTKSNTPVAVSQPAGVTFAQLTVSGTSACGVDGSGQAYCWGSGQYGRLGNGGTTSSSTPVAVSQPSGVTFFQISAELQGVCGLDAVLQTWCWGYNAYGQLGDASTTNRSSPVAVVH